MMTQKHKQTALYAGVLYMTLITQQQQQQHQQEQQQETQQQQALSSTYRIRRHKRQTPRLPEHLIEKQKRDTGQLIVRQTFFDGKPTEILIEKQKFKRPKQAPGRPSERISEDELKKSHTNHSVGYAKAGRDYALALSPAWQTGAHLRCRFGWGAGLV